MSRGWRLLQEAVARQADERPGATAVVDGDRSITYAALHERSLRLARLLAEAGCRRGERVALLLPKSIEALIGMLATLHAGGIYVPLDPASPAARLGRIAADCEPCCVLAGGDPGPRLAAALAALRPAALGWLGQGPVPAPAAFTAADLARVPPEAQDPGTGPDDAAHILFTSGSTGAPKGVVIAHRNVVHFVEWANAYFGAGPGDRTSGHSPLFFDLSSYDVYGSFAAGAALHLVPPELNLLPHKIAAFIRDRRLSQWFSVPAVLNQLAQQDAVRQDDFPDLRRVLWCGEALPVPVLRYWMERLPRVRFTNLYGPTEATIASSHYTVEGMPPGPDVPIGRACPGEDLLLLDGDLRPVLPGAPGDLYIRGAGLGSGYWRDPERTAQVFLDTREHGRIYRTGDRARVDENGLFYFLGRVDSQIKSRGYRIELGEIEWALQSLGCLRESAVVALPTAGFEGHRICCGFVPRDGEPLDEAVLRRRLRQEIPSYMLPSRWLRLERLPRTANGKVDRRAVQARFEEDV